VWREACGSSGSWESMFASRHALPSWKRQVGPKRETQLDRILLLLITCSSVQRLSQLIDRAIEVFVGPALFVDL
jgi:hypothetical protein